MLLRDFINGERERGREKQAQHIWNFFFSLSGLFSFNRKMGREKEIGWDHLGGFVFR